MAVSYPIPPWLEPRGDPAGAYVSALRAGADIAQQNQRLQFAAQQAAIEAQQNAMALQAKREALEAQNMRELQQAEMLKAYQDAQLGLRKQQIETGQAALQLKTAQAARQFAAEEAMRREIMAEPDKAAEIARKYGPAVFGTSAAQLYKPPTSLRQYGRPEFSQVPGAPGVIVAQVPGAAGLQVIRPPGREPTAKEVTDLGNAIAELQKRKRRAAAGEESSVTGEPIVFSPEEQEQLDYFLEIQRRQRERMQQTVAPPKGKSSVKILSIRKK